MVMGLFALVLASTFTGAAFYITLVEQPARLGLADRSLLAEWKPSYKRGFNLQGSLVAVVMVDRGPHYFCKLAVDTLLFDIDQ